MPGVGGKGSGDNFVRNCQKMQEVRLHLDTLFPPGEIDTSLDFLGKRLDLPVFAAPLAAVDRQFGPKYKTPEFARILLEGAQAANTVTFLYDQFVDPEDEGALDRVGHEFEKLWIPTIKPRALSVIMERAKRLQEAGALAICSDLDGVGLSLVQGTSPPIMPLSVEDLSKLVEALDIPLIIKGVMTVAGAKKCVDAGVSAIVVSNHGGRVLEQALASVEVLEDIAKAVSGKLTVLIDGGIRSGYDVFKVCALGAHAVLIGRPYGIAVYGGGLEGVNLYHSKLKSELREAMLMTGAYRLADIQRHMVHVPNSFK